MADGTKVAARAMILAAGMGTRLRPLTDRMPKALVSVNGQPLIDIQMEKLLSAGFSDITVNVHHFADMLEDYVLTHYSDKANVHISSEREKLLNTGGALKRARKYFHDCDDPSPVLVHNVDILSNADLSALYSKAVGVDALLLVSKRNSSRGLFFDKDMRLVGWQNFKTGETKSSIAGFRPEDYVSYAFSGIHVIAPRALESMDHWGDEFSIIDFYIQEAVHLNICGCVASADFRLLDVGKIDVIDEAGKFLSSLNS